MKDKSYPFYKIFKPLIKAFIIIKYRPKVINIEKVPTEGSIVLCGNHKNFSDPLLVGMNLKRPIHFLAKREYHDNLFTRPFFKMVGTIPVDRENKDPKAVETAIEILNKGWAVGLFPEGTRNKTKELLLTFKFGAVSLAKKTNAKVVPFAICGDYKWNSKNLKIVFADPFEIGDMSLEEANTKLKSIVEKMLLENK